ncbi:hypothetical protein FWG95_04465 [Candidatus Saccharibacteria bacterium]|nr:hypothetical protein [Candidatus Saccharibacteria bacterium]
MTTTENSAARGFLPLIFAGGMVSVVLAAVLSVLGISGGIAMLANRAFSFPAVLGWIFGGLGSAAALMIVGVGAVVFTAVGVVMLGRAKKMITAQPEFMNTGAYRGTMFTSVGVMAMLTVAAASAAVAIAITSLLVIGGNVSIKNLYLDEFLPAIIAAVILAAVTWNLLGIAKNKKSFVKMLSIGLIVVASAALVLAGVAVGVKSHSKGSSLNTPGYNLNSGGSNSSNGSNSNSNSGSNSESNKNSNSNKNNSNSSGSGSSNSGSGSSSSGSGSSGSSGTACASERQAYTQSGSLDDYEVYYDCLLDYYGE